MSVGVCIINRNGIALAADSAGTYTGNKMFYNSMNKVFSISRKYVYGVITYGATVIHNVSIDQVLKEFRTFLDSKSEVNDFFEILPSFVEFIEQKNNYYKFDTAETNHCYELIKVLISDWGKKIKNVITTDDVAAQIDDILNDLSAVMQGAIKIENYDVSSYIGTTYKSDFDSLINMIVPELNNCYEMTFFNRKSQRTFTCQIVQNAKRHLKGAKTMQISGIGHSVIRGLGTTGQWFSASTTVYPRGSPQGRRHSYFVDC